MSAHVRPPVPPFTKEPAIQKVRAAEDAWNNRDPTKVPMAYTEDTKWRNRSELFQGRVAMLGTAAVVLLAGPQHTVSEAVGDVVDAVVGTL